MDLGSERGGRRVDRSAAAVGQARREVVAWFAERTDDPRFVRFGPQLRVLDVVLGRMLAALDGRLRELGPELGRTYDDCRAVETMLTVVRRTFAWYRDRYDQRVDPRLGPVLLAADELVRSCWTQPFVALRRTPPQGPLAYVDPRFNAFALTRAAVPVELRPPARTDAVDGAVHALLRELPVATIALPEWVTREAWWLAVAAHETGHLVAREIDALDLDGSGSGRGLADVTRSVLAETVHAADDGRPDLAEQWSSWHGELFADAFSAVMIADAAAWAVDELEHGGPDRLAALSAPGYPYPPPLVRRALLGELARRVRGADPTQAAAAAGGVAEAEAWLGTDAGTAELRRHLAVVPAVADALLALPLGGQRLLDLGAVDQAWYSPHGRVDGWSSALRRDPVPITPSALRGRPAARLAVQAGVAAQLTASPGDLAGLHGRLVTVMRAAGPEGTLAPPPVPAGDLADLATRLTTRLLGGTLTAGPDREREGR
ncbi:hypothetical protein [Frankia sp. AgB32]|uniref:hypothetical protein n=1 Tax=Frankia sp. AgB32 TaxID=631119 RepID=UPI00200BE3EA|nr:hypothetical protein [Frankia sp. AgB32]MCK9896623.1 hypothetical protein [Frankia sp. AgB32]